MDFEVPVHVFQMLAKVVAVAMACRRVTAGDFPRVVPVAELAANVHFRLFAWPLIPMNETFEYELQVAGPPLIALFIYVHQCQSKFGIQTNAIRRVF
jgi:hypothetical protein